MRQNGGIYFLLKAQITHPIDGWTIIVCDLSTPKSASFNTDRKNSGSEKLAKHSHVIRNLARDCSYYGVRV